MCQVSSIDDETGHGITDNEAQAGDQEWEERGVGGGEERGALEEVLIQLDVGRGVSVCFIFGRGTERVEQ